MTDAADGDGGGTKKLKAYKKHILKICLFYIVFPRKGTLTDAGDGDGGH